MSSWWSDNGTPQSNDNKYPTNKSIKKGGSQEFMVDPKKFRKGSKRRMMSSYLCKVQKLYNCKWKHELQILYNYEGQEEM